MNQALSLFPNAAISPAKDAKSGGDAVTPLMAQYFAIKREYADYMVLFRLGDFYELFFDDAVRAAATLGIALTKRGQHMGQDIPMCGVPWHQADSYLPRLIRAGFRVAVCEQSAADTPNAKGGKTLIERKVVRVITPGTLTEDNLLDARRNNFIVGICADGLDGKNGGALAMIDLSTGAFALRDFAKPDLANILAAIEPGEIVVPENLANDPAWADILRGYASILTAQPDARFNAESAKSRLLQLYGVATLDGIGDFSAPSVCAAGALVGYIQLTQQGAVPGLDRPQFHRASAHMQIDAASARNLELRRTLNGERAGSFLSAIDRTQTNSGARLLDTMIAQPLTDPAEINSRLDAVEYFAANADLRKTAREKLARCPDIERAVSRLILNRGSPRDLACLRDGLRLAAEISGDLSAQNSAPVLAARIQRDIGNHRELQKTLQSALAAELPVFARDGGFIAAGYSTELDHLRELRDESHRLIAALQQNYADKTGIANLKIRHNNILGYYIEIQPKFANKMTVDFIHRQTLATAARYTTPELNDMEQKLSRAAAQAIAVEMAIFAQLTGMVANAADGLRLCAASLAALDVYAALAQLAGDEQYTRPVITADLSFDIAGGRHPVVEQSLRARQKNFIANDCRLQENPGNLWLITGPNMAGKSTYLRQNALIAILAQIGSFVPAQQCRIGTVDKIFSRVGAADDLARGQSTFMVEMVESAAILHQSTERSLVILDEVGRGTSTFDGLSIAWAVLEYLHNHIKCRGLFATHYHELTQLTGQLPQLAAYTMRVKEWQNDIVFLHEIAPGAAERSYGIHVAKLAGLPRQVIGRAGEILRGLEKDKIENDKIGGGTVNTPATPDSANPGAPGEWIQISQDLQNLDLDNLSPRAAWDLIADWHKKIAG